MDKVKFYGIDGFNRPVFKSTTSNKYYGSLAILFRGWESEKEVLSKVTANDLCYFGNSFDCEPDGTPAQVEIERGKI